METESYEQCFKSFEGIMQDLPNGSGVYFRKGKGDLWWVKTYGSGNVYYDQNEGGSSFKATMNWLSNTAITTKLSFELRRSAEYAEYKQKRNEQKRSIDSLMNEIGKVERRILEMDTAIKHREEQL